MRHVDECAGFEIDESTYPWVAYQGPRFNPTKWYPCYTELESRLIRTLQDLTDGNFGYWQEVQADTGLSEPRCKEILETIKWVNNLGNTS